MPETITLEDGSDVQAKEVAFETVEEPWGRWRLEDGTLVRMKVVAVRIFRVLDESGEPAYTDDGEPWVVVRNVRHLTAQEPEAE